jgi:hypothetical protein
MGASCAEEQWGTELAPAQSLFAPHGSLGQRALPWPMRLGRSLAPPNSLRAHW